MDCRRRVELVNTSTTLARTLTRELIEGGVTDVVLSPGSRNAPLSIALFAVKKLAYLPFTYALTSALQGFLH